MSTIDDILKVLDRWSEWKRIRETPGLLATLEERIAVLEIKLQRCPGEGCPSCGELEFRIQESKEPPPGIRRRAGAREHHWLCGKCGYRDVKTELI